MTGDARTWLIVGSHGMLATDLGSVLDARGIAATGIDKIHVDITDAASVAALNITADVIVNCAAYTAVDDAETNEELAYAVNATGAANLADAAKRAGSRFVHISTDYVFAGNASSPYAEGDPTDPQGAYGRTKAAGERLVLDSGADAIVVRTAWLYGANGPCFPKTIARLAASRDSLSVVDDQRGQPTWTRDLAELIVALIEADAPAGTYHGTSTGEATWFDFAREIVAASGLTTRVDPVTTEAFPRPAPRPAFSVLGHDATDAIGLPPIGHWLERWRVAAREVLAGA